MFARRQCRPNSRVHNDEQRPNDDRFAQYMLSSKLYGAHCFGSRVRYRLKWLSIPQFLTRDAMLARYMLSSCVRLSVCPSVTGRGIEQRYSSASDREKKQTKKQCAINTKIQSVGKIIKRSAVLYRNDSTNRAGFRHGSFPPPVPHTVSLGNLGICEN